ncbi:MAG: serine/threonine protein kinase [Candidatus Wallbacteria bacterium]|nr:serine/threonine protein kinase [Candidatus Wallbacteria bacterium]
MPGDDETPGRTLDLYEGLDAAAASPGVVAPGPAPEANRSDASFDWIESLWTDFPRAIRERYRPVKLIGEGGMGVVIEAEDLELARTVAVKGLRDPARGSREEDRARQGREARLNARLTHPNILPVFDIWNDHRGNPWCAMLRVPGDTPTLARRLEELRDQGDFDRRPISALLQTFLQICRAISYAHGRGVLHRDLKPENILIGPTGEALVADWGLAASGDPADGQLSDLVGTQGYAAPEQLGLLGPPRADERSDVYSLGIVLFEMLAGRRHSDPRTRASPNVEPPNLATPARLPAELRRIVQRAAAWRPEDRFPSADALMRALDAYLGHGLVEGMEYSPGERLAKLLRARPGLSATVVVLLIVAPLWAITHLRDAGMTRRNLLEANKFLARAETGWAAFARGSGQAEVAEHHLAKAFRALAECRPGTLLPPAAYTFLAGERPLSRLVWACTLDWQPIVVRFGPEERSVAAASSAGFLELALPSGDVAARTRLDLGDCWNASLSPDGRLLATAGADRVLRLIAVPGGKPAARFSAQESPFWACGFGPDSRWIATGCFDGTVRTWDVQTGRKLASYEGCTTMVWVLSVSPDGRFIAVGNADREVCVWETASRRLAHRLRGHRATVQALTFTPNSQALASSADDATILLWDMASGRQVESIPTERMATRIAFTRDASVMAFGDSDSSIRVRSMRERRELGRLVGHAAWLYALDFSGDGRLLVSGSKDRTLRLWDVSQRVQDPAFRGHSAPIDALAFDRAGTRLATAGRDHTIRLWNFPKGSSAATAMPVTHGVGDLAFDGRGELLALTALRNGAEVLTASRNACRTLALPAAGRIDFLQFDRTTERFAVGESGGVSEIFETESLRKLLRLQEPGGDTLSVTFSPDGRTLAACGTYRDVILYHADDPRPWRRMKGPITTVMGLAFSPDGSQLASCGEDGDVWLWDVTRGTGTRVTRHEGRPRCAAFSPDGRTLASGGQEGMIRILRLPGAELVASLDAGGREVSALAFSPDGARLVSSGSNDVHVWDLSAIVDPAPVVARLEAASFFEQSEDGMTLAPLPLGRVPAPRFPAWHRFGAR